MIELNNLAVESSITDPVLAVSGELTVIGNEETSNVEEKRYNRRIIW